MQGIQERRGSIHRQTKETDIRLTLQLDGQGKGTINTGVPFLNHMLDLFQNHGLFHLDVEAKGDIEIDSHHTTEDIGICLGQCIVEALGDKRGIQRYGEATVPMDESLVTVVLDLSNRPAFVLKGDVPKTRLGTFETEVVEEFFWKIAIEARMNLHIHIHYGSNTHHIIEAMFKAFARALDKATQMDERRIGVPSTKGSL